MSSTPPPLPPTTEAERISWLRLLRSRRVGPENFYRLIAEYGSAESALDALPEIAAARGLKRYSAATQRDAEAEFREGKRMGARLLAAGEPDYPNILFHLKGPPPLLWALGTADMLARQALAVVGSRNATALGLRLARCMAAELSEAGYVIVSGLARGIDAAAHNAALRGGTIAVLGGAIDHIYPKENVGLARAIQEQGLLLSEAPLGTAPQAKLFPPRNRIIAGLAQAVIVIEAAQKSGTLITARDALDIGRDVLAVPGHPFDGHAAGCNSLIRDGATLVRSARDVLDALSPLSPPCTTPPRPRAEPSHDTPKSPPLEPVQAKLLASLSASPIAEDDLIRATGLPTAHVMPALAEMELMGQIIRSRGGMVCKAE